MSFVYVPNGIIMPDWKPAEEGSAFAFTRILKPLEPLRQDVLVLSGLAHNNANELGDGPGDHARAAACFLTGVHPKKTAGRRHPERNLGRPDRGPGAGLGDAAAFPGARVRGVAHGGQLRLRLQLRLHQQHLLARRHHAHASGDEPAPGLRAALRRQRRFRSRRPGPAGSRADQRPRRRGGADERAHGTAGRAPTAASWTSTNTRSGRSSGRSSRRRRTRGRWCRPSRSRRGSRRPGPNT